jgi:SAM-dependent methyltransferase
MSHQVNNNSKVYYTGKYWNDYPECLSLINTRLFGKNIDWKTNLIDKDLIKFKHALILNCGNGWVERELYDAGIILKATGVEYNKELIDECIKNKEERDINYIQHDINTIYFDENTFDCVINFAACHHIRYIEEICINIRKWLKPDGYFIHNDYIGPQRNQYSKSQWLNMNTINNSINVKYNKNLGYPDIQQMMNDDPTEAINSNRIIQVLYDLFNIDTHTKSGGAITYEILTHNSKLFNAPLDIRQKIVKMVMEKDLEYLNKSGDSFFHFIIARNNKEVSDDIEDKYLKQMNIREELADKTFGHYSYNYLEKNDIIYCNQNNSYGKSFFVYGFSDIEPTGRWSIGDSSIIRFNYKNNDNIKLQINVNSMPNIQQKVIIEINEMKVIEKIIKSECILELPLIQNKDYPNEMVIIFKYDNVKTPKELGLNNDGRKLGLFFRWIKLI